MSARTFTDDVEPPFGERITLMDVTGAYVVWNGKRWAPQEYAHDGQMYDCWPPSGRGEYIGPYFEVVAAVKR